MKRINLNVDENLLEQTRRYLGEKTYSGAIAKALERVLRQEKFWEAQRKWEDIAHTEGMFDPEYLKEKSRKSIVKPKSKRVSAHDARAPRHRKRRGSR